jgi:hypothetical protein
VFQYILIVSGGCELFGRLSGERYRTLQARVPRVRHVVESAPSLQPRQRLRFDVDRQAVRDKQAVDLLHVTPHRLRLVFVAIADPPCEWTYRNTETHAQSPKDHPLNAEDQLPG